MRTAALRQTESTHGAGAAIGAARATTAAFINRRLSRVNQEWAAVQLQPTSPRCSRICGPVSSLQLNSRPAPWEPRWENWAASRSGPSGRCRRCRLLKSATGRPLKRPAKFAGWVREKPGQGTGEAGGSEAVVLRRTDPQRWCRRSSVGEPIQIRSCVPTVRPPGCKTTAPRATRSISSTRAPAPHRNELTRSRKTRLWPLLAARMT